MPESTKYSGNPFISRRERQASVLLYNRKADEVDKEAVYVEKQLTKVKWMISNANGFSTDGAKKLCSCTLWVELRDGNPGYISLLFRLRRASAIIATALDDRNQE